MSSRTLEVARDGTLLSRAFLDDPRVSRLLTLLDADGETARVVGGAVRNAALGLPPGDIDIATTALPEEVTRRARGARLRVLPTGVEHGTVTVVVAGLPLEVTTLREDVETDGRHAVVRFGRDFAADAARRDFTINAMSVDANGRVWDTTGGLADLAAGRVRFIGDPGRRIREDYLRILRFFRFSASYAVGPVDPSGLAAAVAEASGLKQLSRERMRAELLKLLSAPRAAEVVAAMGRASLLDLVVGTACRPPRFARLRAVLAAREADPDPILGLAALAMRGEIDAHTLRNTLRLSNGERDRLLRIAFALNGKQENGRAPNAHDISGLLFAQGRSATLDILTIRHVDGVASPDDPGWQAALRFATIAEIPALPVSGADVMARGVAHGPRVGQTLKTLQALWIRAGFPQSPAALHDLLDRAIETAQGDDQITGPAA